VIIAVPMRPVSLGDGPPAAPLDPDLAARSTDPALRPLIAGLAEAAAVARPVLLVGEAGVGKGYFARRIHRLGRGSDAGVHVAFAVGLGASRLESLLQGRFAAPPGGPHPATDAFEDGGLDAPPSGLPTLLIRNLELLDAPAARVLGQWIGSGAPAMRRVRLIATAEPIVDRRLPDLVAADHGRGPWTPLLRLAVPALRARTHDRIALATDLLRGLAAELDRPVPALSLQGWRCVMQRSWRGNVRELGNALRQAMLMSDPRRPLNL
jgi:sigma-54-specific transcriptional regulator